MTLFHDRCDEMVAALPGVFRPPVILGYGSDLWCVDDVTPQMHEIPALDTTLIAQSVYRSLTTPRGLLPDSPDRGIDLVEELHFAADPQHLLEVESKIYSEVVQDDRIDDGSVSVTVARVSDSECAVTILAKVDNAPFRLVLALDDAQVVLREISR